MEDKNNLIVYCEYDEGRIADVSLELLTKGRQLATRLGCRLEALVLGDKLDGIEQELFPYGVDVVYKVQDERLFPYTSLPHSSVVTTLFKEIEADPEQIGMAGSPTKVKTIVNVAFQAKEARRIDAAADAELEGLVKELIADHIIG